jgi:hypothetical protein
VLRIAAETVSLGFGHVDYFPSYEMVTGNFNRGRLFRRRSAVAHGEGSDHVMRVFAGHYLAYPDDAPRRLLRDEAARSAL